MRYLYDAKLVPIGQPVNIPDERGRRGFYTFNERSFEIERKRPNNIDVRLKHDRSKRIGKLANLITHKGWWLCDFTLDPALRSELKVGQPVSIGLTILAVGSGDPILTEVSIVPRGAVDGACITRRHELKPVPSQRTEQPNSPARTADRATAEPIVYRTPVEDPFMVELQRRMDWVERRTGRPANMEEVLDGMRRELHGPSLDEVYAEHLIRSRLAA